MREQRRNDGVPIGHGASMCTNVVGGVAGRFHGSACRLVESHIQTDAHDHVHGPTRLRAHLDEDAAEFAAGGHEIVGPLEPDAGHVELGERIDGAQADDERQRGEIGGQIRVLPRKRQTHGASRRRDPPASASPAAAGLMLGQNHGGAAGGRGK
jgi:hypothetical protein